MVTAPVVEFQILLRELFQFDCAGLDFGISCSVSNVSLHGFRDHHCPESLARGSLRRSIATEAIS
ncbi:protein of unknown function [Candidatus Methylomirabilis oxygeniifera]|uniref:Uncharacterized protein n=1 Tax=Methylomirabilis oxygeniifera TaxID=671143 RepID=D5MIT0_METO1|nr:protein of unknown function [Candidatus Methylomirabilis oxyfera]